VLANISFPTYPGFTFSSAFRLASPHN